MPALQLKKLYYIYLSIIALFFILVLYAPVFVFGPPLVTLLFTLFFFVPLLLVITFAVYWIDRFYYTIKYKLTSNEMIWRRGVWFRNTGVVPYNRITNI
ncbi:MAG: PH domain-containing protein, partial [Candidatus Aenigmarchaeota archaeon]|nr:PH domain-containing protein [Candidatus Aenigmarchaeota archaeon]NIQ17521.1 PH domain-containing protein [Candidatus Aenigmarchaeota archaeon]NIS73099.1 PH domain-containing protein [Candidatus Aenigmarchaeota archaeon]